MELGEYDISGPTEYMSTKEKAVSKDDFKLLVKYLSWKDDINF